MSVIIVVSGESPNNYPSVSSEVRGIFKALGFEWVKDKRYWVLDYDVNPITEEDLIHLKWLMRITKKEFEERMVNGNLLKIEIFKDNVVIRNLGQEIEKEDKEKLGNKEQIK